MLVLPFLSCYTEGCSVSLGKTNLCSCLKEPKMTQGYFFILQDTVKGSRAESKRAAASDRTV